jgi:hypothetical protein
LPTIRVLESCIETGINVEVFFGDVFVDCGKVWKMLDL